MRQVFILLFLMVIGSVIAKDQQIDYGADAVNALQETKGMVQGGEDNYDFFHLKNHCGPSGVPLGGIGTGCFDIAPDGCFTRIALNNTHEDGVLKDIKGSFLAFWDGQQAKLLQLKQACSIEPIENVTYTGLFPIIKCDYGNGVVMEAYSGLIPHNIKDSSLPVVWFDVSIQNTTNEEGDFSVAFSWQDVISRNIFDIRDLSIFKEFGNDAWAFMAARKKYPGKVLNPIDRVDTYVKPIEAGGYSGLLQYADELKPNRATYQNYVNNVAILAEKNTDARITFLPAWEIENPDAWASFNAHGEFTQNISSYELYEKSKSNEAASAVAIKIHLKKNERKTIRLMLVWYYPELTMDQYHGDTTAYFWFFRLWSLFS